MFEDFFQMKQTPFSKGIPISSLYEDKDTEEIHSRLVYAAQNRLFALLIGDSGAGKTTTLRRLKDSLERREFAVLYIADSKLTPRNFYNDMLRQLGCDPCHVRCDARRSLHKQVEMMSLVDNRHVVVIVDEGHLLDKDMLEEVRFLLNYKMDSENPLTLIISGQTELWDRLQRSSYNAIRHRVDIQCFIQHYELSQTKAYIERHLTYAGYTSPLFSDAAIQVVHDFSSGIPRLINRVCTQSLNFAYQNRRTIIDDHMVELVLNGELN